MFFLYTTFLLSQFSNFLNEEIDEFFEPPVYYLAPWVTLSPTFSCKKKIICFKLYFGFSVCAVFMCVYFCVHIFLDRFFYVFFPCAVFSVYTFFECVIFVMRFFRVGFSVSDFFVCVIFFMPF